MDAAKACFRGVFFCLPRDEVVHQSRTVVLNGSVGQPSTAKPHRTQVHFQTFASHCSTTPNHHANIWGQMFYSERTFSPHPRGRLNGVARSLPNFVSREVHRSKTRKKPHSLRFQGAAEGESLAPPAVTVAMTEVVPVAPMCCENTSGNTGLLSLVHKRDLPFSRPVSIVSIACDRQSGRGSE
ncbi:hypothetical protein RISK_000121 [Rhodopirellula islandica]|uniref:Uncharacterized protein n=1 Tax=Rhodopirellula islandica TaxID=595434 RepID=A0A0J1BN94_RHOIS|nr:hypothetical protein RISK_000121 [Rhodopirellula islandica]